MFQSKYAGYEFIYVTDGFTAIRTYVLNRKSRDQIKTILQVYYLGSFFNNHLSLNITYHTLGFKNGRAN